MAGVTEQIDQRLGPAADLLQDLAEEPAFDAVFLDADKVNYPRYLELCTPILRPGGLLITDNVFCEGGVIDPSATDPDTAGDSGVQSPLGGG